MYADKLSNISYEQAAHRPGAQTIKELMERCMLWAEISYRRKGKIAPQFKETFDNLVQIRNQLEKLALTQAWSLRETDLYSFQRKLDRVDESRVNGHFLDAHGNPADLFEQRVSYLSFCSDARADEQRRHCCTFCASRMRQSTTC